MAQKSGWVKDLKKARIGLEMARRHLHELKGLVTFLEDKIRRGDPYPGDSADIAAKSQTEKTLDRIQNSLLVHEFWRKFKVSSNSNERIQLLRYFCQKHLEADRPSRSSRNEFKKSEITRRRRCAACHEYTQKIHRHHIIQLRYGGRNIPANVISLCEFCHKLVHSSQSYVSMAPNVRKLGPPRLVKKAHIPLPMDAGSSPLIDGGTPYPQQAELVPALN